VVWFGEVYECLLRLKNGGEIGTLQKAWRGRDERNMRIKNGFILE